MQAKNISKHNPDRPKTDKNEDWRKLHNEKLHSLYCLPNIVRVIKSRRIRCAGLITITEECRSAFKF